MIFIRNLVTYGQATWMAANDIHDPQTCPNIQPNAFNGSHSLMMTIMTQDTVSKWLDRGGGTTLNYKLISESCGWMNG